MPDLEGGPVDRVADPGATGHRVDSNPAWTVNAEGRALTITTQRPGATIGVGSVRRLSTVRWGIGEQIVWARILTIPMSEFIAARTF